MIYLLFARVNGGWCGIASGNNADLRAVGTLRKKLIQTLCVPHNPKLTPITLRRVCIDVLISFIGVIFLRSLEYHDYTLFSGSFVAGRELKKIQFSHHFVLFITTEVLDRAIRLGDY